MDDNRNKNRRTYPRYRVRLKTRVQVRSIGSLTRYEFDTENVSNGGIFVRGKEGAYPFRPETILEIWLTLGSDEEEDKVFFNGKIMHNYNGGFGIKVIQISDKDAARLAKYIEDYKEKFPDKLVP